MYVHSSRIQKQLEYLDSLGFNKREVCQSIGIKEGDENDPERTFSFDQYISLLDFALDLTGDDNYGLKFGSRPELGGTIGMMSASCKNLREAFITGCQFLRVQGNFAELSFIDDARYPKLVYKLVETWPLQNPKTAKLEVDAMFAFLSSILKINSNNTMWPYAIRMTIDKPDDIDAYKDIFDFIPDFNCDTNEMVFDAGDLMIPMKAFNPETFQLLKSHLEEQIRKIENKESVTDKVKRILLSFYQYHFPDIETVASKLNLSSRTLQRYLSGEDTSFKEILLDTKTEIAKKLIKQGHLTISEISFTLGYSDIGNFSRSFKKNTGMSPGEFRQFLNLRLKPYS